MTFIKSKEIHLASRPVGLPKSEDFALKEVEINSPNDGEVLVKNHFSAVSLGTEKSTISIAKSSLIQKAMKRPKDFKKVFTFL